MRYVVPTVEQSDLNEVLVFTRVVADNSFSGAARSLGMPKSTVSRRVADLEERLGVRLLQRTTRTLRLTDAGAEYYDRASRVVEELAEAERLVRGRQQAPQGTLRITAPNDLGLGLVRGLIADFLVEHPDVDVSLQLTQRFVDLVDEGVDLAVRAGSLPDSTLVARKLSRGYARVYASPDYVDRNGAPASMAELANHPTVLLGSELIQTWKLFRGSKPVEVRVRGRMAVDDFSAVKQGTIDGVGVALLPEFHAEPDVAAERLVPVLPEFHTAETGVYIVYPSARYLPAKARAFIEFALQRASFFQGARRPSAG